MIDYFTLIKKEYVIHMHGPALYMKEGVPFTLDLTLWILNYIFDCF